MAPDATPLDLDAIRARCEAAAPGPWVVMVSARHGFSYGSWGRRDIYNWSVRSAGSSITGQTFTVAADSGPGVPPDAAFIACARSDVPALVAEVERLRRVAAIGIDGLRRCAEVSDQVGVAMADAALQAIRHATEDEG